MKKFNVVAASAVALTAALASGSALAHGTLATTVGINGTPIRYNAAAVTAAGGTITVPWSGLASAVYTVTSTATSPSNPNGTTSLEVNSRLTITLPTGFTFFSAPALATTAPGTTVTSVGGGIGNQTAVFQINGAPVLQGQSLTLNQVSVSGATSLETPGTTLFITAQAINNSLISNNDAAPVTATNPTFVSTTGVSASFTAPASPAFIDLHTPSLGTKFLQTGASDTVNADIGTLSLTPDGSLGADGAALVLGTADTASVSINGFFNGISGAFSTVGGQGCAATAVSTGTATASSIAIPAASVGATNDLCITANGSTLLTPNANLTLAYTPGAGVTDFLGGQATNVGDPITYTGGQTISVTNFLTGQDAGYTSLVRLNNANSVTNELFAVAQPYTGGPALVGTLGTIGAGQGTVYTSATIATATGLTLANSGQRATLTIIASPGSVAAGGLLVNPGGTVDQVNQ